MAGDARVAMAQQRLDAARREIREAVANFDVTDEQLLEMRANARHAYEELKELDRKYGKGFFGFKLW